LTYELFTIEISINIKYLLTQKKNRTKKKKVLVFW